MKRALRVLVGIMATLLLSAQASESVAQQPDANPVERDFDRDCMDDYGRDLCAPENWREIVESFDLDPAEGVQAQGWRGVRVFTINGYSRDMPMVSVLYTEQSDSGYPSNAQLEVRAARAAGIHVPTLKRAAWPGLAFSAADIGKLATAAPVRQSSAAGTGDDEFVMCLHAWVTVTEVLSDDGVLRRVRNACGDDPLYEAAYDISAKALRGFPECNHLDPANYRNESEQLNRCMALAGDDQIAAAEVLNLLDGEVFDEAANIVKFSTPETLVSGAGESTTLSAALWLQQARVVRLYATTVRSVGNDVVVEGSTHRYGHGDDDDFEADTRQRWRRSGASWQLLEFNIGPWRSI